MNPFNPFLGQWGIFGNGFEGQQRYEDYRLSIEEEEKRAARDASSAEDEDGDAEDELSAEDIPADDGAEDDGLGGDPDGDGPDDDGSGSEDAEF